MFRKGACRTQGCVPKSGGSYLFATSVRAPQQAFGPCFLKKFVRSCNELACKERKRMIAVLAHPFFSDSQRRSVSITHKIVGFSDNVLATPLFGVGPKTVCVRRCSRLMGLPRF